MCEFATWNIEPLSGTVHIDGAPGTPDEARRLAARLLVAADAAEHQCAVALAFRALEHHAELTAHDSGRDLRTEN